MTTAFDEAQHPREARSGRFSAKPTAAADPAAQAALAAQAAGRVGLYDFGDEAGLVAAHTHLNPDGTEGGWVADTATVDPAATVAAGAFVYGRAVIGPGCRILDRAAVGDQAQVTGEAVVSGDASVYDQAQVVGPCTVTGRVRLAGDAAVTAGVLDGDIRLTRGLVGAPPGRPRRPEPPVRRWGLLSRR